jgi:hypothetical protein
VEAKTGVEEETSSPVGGWEEPEGGFTLRTDNGDYKMVAGGLIQARFDGIGWDDASGLDNTATFQVRRARGLLVGNFMGKQNTFFLQFGADTPDAYLFPEDTSSEGFELFDAWAKHEFSPGFAIKAGQFKVPFSRQDLESPGKLQFATRSLAVERSGFDRRDVGVEVSGDFSQGMLQYALALVNGDGRNSLNVGNELGLYGRLVVNPTGDYGYDEGDMIDRSELASTLGFAFHYQENAPILPDGDIWRVNLEGGVKKSGASVQGEFHASNQDPAEFLDKISDDLVDPEDFTNKGWYLQAGYFIKDSRAELVARASRLLLEGDENDESEYSFGINVFCKGHRLKMQAAYSYLDQDFLDLEHHRFVGQAQIWF